MHVVLRQTAGARELEVGLRNPEATLHDVLQAMVDQVPESVAIDGRVVPSAARVLDAGLYEGAVLALRPDGDAARTRAGLELVVLAGPQAGRTFGLGAGRWSIGRDATNRIVLDDETISRAHAELELDEQGAGRIIDLGSANGTYVDGLEVDGEAALGAESVIGLGAVALAVRTAIEDDRPLGLDVRRHLGPSGTVAFNRPPRLSRAVAPTALEPPAEPGDPPPAHFSLATTVGPLILAVVMVALTRDIRFALFSLLSPFIGVGTYVESRRRNTVTKQRDLRKYAEDVERFAEHVDEAGTSERARRWERSPDPAEALRRAALPSTHLWERRPQHDDFLSLFAGIGDLTWHPPVEGRADKLAPPVADVLHSDGLRAAPVAVELARGGVLGIVGERPLALAVARSLICQAAVHHGPADLTIGVFVDDGREPDWVWAKWLPHTRSGDEQWLSARRERSEALLRRIATGAASGTPLVVLDSDLLVEGRSAPAREVLRGGTRRTEDGRGEERFPVAGIVVSSTRDRLPAACNTVIEITSPDGDAVMHRDSVANAQELIVAGLAAAGARACARDLARFEDPELRQVGAGLPDSVRLLPLLELDGVNPDAVRQRWRRSGMPARPAAPLGVTEQGIFTLDLERDGPHGLVGGTTGSGKSELLRSLIAALAANADPRQLTFLLMDFKGGAAFDACARLPHTVGMVTDLDEGLVDRALRALEAEPQYRERLLRSAGADNLRAYHERDHSEPLPRLVVVIDEFAKMAREQPELLASLVDVAQRGRTLGVHLILATQRPAGVVNDHIRTNTNLRIALRVQDAEDSLDVIGERAAAELSRHRPGRAYFRLGPDEVVPIQTALATCVTDATSDAAVEVSPFAFGETPLRTSGDAAEPDRRAEQPSDLARLVDAIIEANAAEGIAPARKPWPEPLPAQIDLAELAGVNGGGAFVALADEPQRQTQYPVGWDLGEGNLLLFGIPGSGTTTALASLVLSLAGLHPPEQLEVYALDFGAGDLRALEALPHTGSVVLAGDRERQMRLIRRLRRELDQRRTSGPAATTVVVIDNLAALRAEFDDPAGMELMDALSRVYADGPQVGIHLAVSADRANTVPTGWMANTTQKWLFRLADRYDYVSLGLTVKDVPPAMPGRAVMAGNGLQIQLGRPQPSLAGAAAVVAGRHPRSTPAATPVGVLPAEVALDAAAQLGEEPWRIPIGVRESDLEVAELVLYEGEHAIVAGPARSGKSLTLWTLAERLAGAGLTIAAVAGRRSPLPECPALDQVAAAGEAGALLAQLRVQHGPIVLLVDDAEGIDDADGAIAGLLGGGRPDLHVIAAARADSLRTLYSHWTQEIRRSKVGLLLRPNIDYDGDLVGTTLPRRAPVHMIPGRGYLAHNGELEIVQVAKPNGTP